jgi:hypothetical protein
LDPSKEYAVYEFWGRRFVGCFRGSFPAAAQEAKGVCVYSIREKLNRPQILSTNRHVSQGGVDLKTVKWDAETASLSGSSDVVVGDRYELTLLVPDSFAVEEGRFGEADATTQAAGGVVRVSFVPTRTGKVRWLVGFD